MIRPVATAPGRGNAIIVAKAEVVQTATGPVCAIYVKAPGCVQSAMAHCGYPVGIAKAAAIKIAIYATELAIVRIAMDLERRGLPGTGSTALCVTGRAGAINALARENSSAVCATGKDTKDVMLARMASALAVQVREVAKLATASAIAVNAVAATCVADAMVAELVKKAASSCIFCVRTDARNGTRSPTRQMVPLFFPATGASI